MRTSIIAGFRLFAAMGAGHGAVFAKKPVDTTNRHPIAKAETGRPAEFQLNVDYRRTFSVMTSPSPVVHPGS